MTVILDLPMPPSVNKVWRVGAGGRVYRDPKYVAWQRTAGWEVAASRPGRFPPGTKVAVTIKAGKVKRARDVDNLGKGLLDLIQSVGIVGNDRDVVDLRIAWDDATPAGRVQVEIEAIASRRAA